jgi:hypothetical protein
MRVPEEQRDAAGPRDRRCEQRELRDHVHEHGVGSARCAEHGGFECGDAAGARRRVEEPHARIRRRVPVRVARHDRELVDPLRECFREVDRLRERRVRRVERLRDEGELHQRAPASTRSTRSR